MHKTSLLISKSRTHKLLRAVSAALVISFLAQDISYAAPEIKNIPFSSVFRAGSPLSMPDTIATVDESASLPSSDRTITLIQDAHTNDSAQLNLSQALERVLESDPKLQTVFLEAGTGDDSLSYLRARGDRNERERVAKKYLRKGLLHGEELLDLSSDRPFRLWGVEDPAEYAEALGLYRRTVAARKRFIPVIQNIEVTIGTLKPRVYGPALAELDARRAAFEKKEIRFTDYFNALKSAAASAGVALDGYRELAALSRVLEKEAAIDFKKAQAEASERGEGPEFAKFLAYQKEAEQLKAPGMAAELSSLEETLTAALAGTDDERALWTADKTAGAWRKLLELSITPEEFEAFEKYFSANSQARVEGFLNRKLMELGGPYERALYLEPGLDEAIEVSARFYRQTERRNATFFKNLTAKMDADGAASAVLIAGGFHTPGLKALFRKNNISCRVITPRVLNETNASRYEEILLSQNVSAAAPATANALRPFPMRQVPAVLSLVEAELGAPSAVAAGARLAEKPSRELEASVRELMFRHTDGIGIASTVAALKKAGILDLLEQKASDGRWITMADIIERARLTMGHANAGYLHVAMRLLALQGWIRREGESATDAMRFTLTPLGVEALRFAPSYELAARYMNALSDIGRILFPAPAVEAKHSLSRIRFDQMAALASRGWGPELTSTAGIQVNDHLDGILAGAILIELRTRIDNGVLRAFAERVPETGALVFAGPFRLEDFGVDAGSLRAAFEFLKKLGWISYRDGRYEITPAGQVALEKAWAYGVTVSYLPLLSQVSTLLYDPNPAQVFVRDAAGHETWVNRAMNVRGSGESHKLYFKKIDEILFTIFDNEDWDSQPKGVADMGSGNGELLKHIYEIVLRTKRGQHLKEHPLGLIGADYNEAARDATHKTLSDARIPHQVMFGDINDPAGYERDLKKLFGIDANDLLHVRSFLDHNRPYTGIRDFEEAARNPSASTGSFSDKGRAIPNTELEQNLVEHLRGWSKLSKHGLLMIELSTVDTGIAAAARGKTLATAYDATHGYSDQYILEQSVVLRAAERAGLELEPKYFAAFPPGDRPTVGIFYFRRKPAAAARLASAYHLRQIRTQIAAGGRFERAPGIRGAVMEVFTMPGLPIVIKVIRNKYVDMDAEPAERFQEIDRSSIQHDYEMVSRVKHGGRILDSVLVRTLKLPKTAFDPQLLSEITETSPDSVIVKGGTVLLKDFYLQKRVTPFSLYVREPGRTEPEKREAYRKLDRLIQYLAEIDLFVDVYGDAPDRNFGVDEKGNVVLFDNDKIMPVTTLDFLGLPDESADEQAAYRTDEDTMESIRSAQSVDGVFPEKVLLFLQIANHTGPPSRLLDKDYWNAVKARLSAQGARLSSAFQKALRERLHGTKDRFVEPEGVKGWVMQVITLPSFPYVLKVHRDSTIKSSPMSGWWTEQLSRKKSVADLSDRLLQTILIPELKVERARFSETMLADLLKTAPRSVRVAGAQVVLTNVVVQEKVRPLKSFLEDPSVSDSDKRRAVLDYGSALKELAEKGIYAGDVHVKNFGVNAAGRVLLFDFDGIETDLARLTFKDEESGSEDDDLSPDDHRSGFGPDDAVPANLRLISGLGPYQAFFERTHGDLYTAAFWNGVKERLQTASNGARLSAVPTWAKFIIGFMTIASMAFVGYRLGLFTKHSAFIPLVASNIAIFSIFTLTADLFGQWIAGHGFKKQQMKLAFFVAGPTQAVITLAGAALINLALPQNAAWLPSWLVMNARTIAYMFVVVKVRTIVNAWFVEQARYKENARRLRHFEALLAIPQGSLAGRKKMKPQEMLTQMEKDLAEAEARNVDTRTTDRIQEAREMYESIKALFEEARKSQAKQTESFWIARPPSYLKNYILTAVLPPGFETVGDAIATQFFQLFYSWSVNKDGFIVKNDRLRRWHYLMAYFFIGPFMAVWHAASGRVRAKQFGEIRGELRAQKEAERAKPAVIYDTSMLGSEAALREEVHGPGTHTKGPDAHLSAPPVEGDGTAGARLALKEITLADIEPLIPNETARTALQADSVLPPSVVLQPGHARDDLPSGNLTGRPTLLITGGAGFIGNNFVRYLLKTHPSYQIIVLDKFTYAGPKESLLDILGGPDASRVKVYEGDVADAAAVSELVSRADAVVHFAAESNVDLSYVDPESFERTNVIGTRTVAQAVTRENERRARARNARVRFIHISTDEVYGDTPADGERYFSEESAYGPTNPYAKTKVGAEAEVMSENRRAGSKAGGIIVRMTNNYGPYKYPMNLLPVAVLHHLLGMPVPIFGRGDKERDWLNVFDFARALDIIVHQAEPGEVLNVAGNDPRTLVNAVVTLFSQIDRKRRSMGELVSQGRVQILKENRPHNDIGYPVDDFRFRDRFTFRTAVAFEDGVRELARWYMQHPHWWARLLSEPGFDRYMSRLYMDYPEKLETFRKKLARFVERYSGPSRPRGARLAEVANAIVTIHTTPQMLSTVSTDMYGVRESAFLFIKVLNAIFDEHPDSEIYFSNLTKGISHRVYSVIDFPDLKIEKGDAVHVRVLGPGAEDSLQKIEAFLEDPKFNNLEVHFNNAEDEYRPDAKSARTRIELAALIVRRLLALPLLRGIVHDDDIEALDGMTLARVPEPNRRDDFLIQKLAEEDMVTIAHAARKFMSKPLMDVSGLTGEALIRYLQTRVVKRRDGSVKRNYSYGSVRYMYEFAVESLARAYKDKTAVDRVKLRDAVQTFSRYLRYNDDAGDFFREVYAGKDAWTRVSRILLRESKESLSEDDIEKRVIPMMLAFAAIKPVQRPVRFADDMAPMVFRGADGTQLVGYYLAPSSPEPDKRSPVALLLSGQGQSSVVMETEARKLHVRFPTLGVLMLDARAHGESEGFISTWGHLESRDIPEVIRQLGEKTELGIDTDRIAGVGQLNGARSLLIAAERGTPFTALVLESLPETYFFKSWFNRLDWEVRWDIFQGLPKRYQNHTMQQIDRQLGAYLRRPAIHAIVGDVPETDILYNPRLALEKLKAKGVEPLVLERPTEEETADGREARVYRYLRERLGVNGTPAGARLAAYSMGRVPDRVDPRIEQRSVAQFREDLTDLLEKVIAANKSGTAAPGAIALSDLTAELRALDSRIAREYFNWSEMSYDGVKQMREAEQVRLRELYRDIRKARESREAGKLESLNLTAIAVHRRLIRLRLASAIFFAEGRAGLPRPSTAQLPLLLDAAIDNAAAIERGLHYSYKRNAAQRRMRQYDATDGLGGFVRVFSLKGYDIEVRSNAEKGGPRVTVRASRWRNALSSLRSALRDLRNERREQGLEKLRYLISLYTVQSTDRAEPLTVGHEEAVAAKIGALIPEALRDPKSSAVEQLSREIEALIPHPKIRGFKDIPYDDEAKAFRGKLHTIESQLKEVLTVLAREAALGYYALVLERAAGRSQLSRDDKEELVRELSEIRRWAKRGNVPEKDRIVAGRAEDALLSIERQDYAAASRQLREAAAALGRRASEIERSAGHVRDHAAALYTALRDKDALNRIEAIRAALENPDGGPAAAAEALNDRDLLIQDYSGGTAAEPGWNRAVRLLKEMNASVSRERMLKRLKVAAADIRRKHDFRAAVVLGTSRAQGFYHYTAPGGTTGDVILELIRSQKIPPQGRVKLNGRYFDYRASALEKGQSFKKPLVDEIELVFPDARQGARLASGHARPNLDNIVRLARQSPKAEDRLAAVDGLIHVMMFYDDNESLSKIVTTFLWSYNNDADARVREMALGALMRVPLAGREYGSSARVENLAVVYESNLSNLHPRWQTLTALLMNLSELYPRLKNAKLKQILLDDFRMYINVHSVKVRRAAFKALLGTHDTGLETVSTVSDHIRAADESDNEIRLMALQWLAENQTGVTYFLQHRSDLMKAMSPAGDDLGPETQELLQALSAAASDPDPKIRAAALEAIRAFPHYSEELSGGLRSAIQYPDMTTQRAALQVAGAMGRAGRHLTSFLRSFQRTAASNNQHILAGETGKVLDQIRGARLAVYRNWAQVPGVPVFKRLRPDGTLIVIYAGTQRMPYTRSAEEKLTLARKTEAADNAPFELTIRRRNGNVVRLSSDLRSAAMMITKLEKAAAYAKDARGYIRPVPFQKNEKAFINRLLAHIRLKADDPEPDAAHRAPTLRIAANSHHKTWIELNNEFAQNPVLAFIGHDNDRLNLYINNQIVASLPERSVSAGGRMLNPAPEKGARLAGVEEALELARALSREERGYREMAAGLDPLGSTVDVGILDAFGGERDHLALRFALAYGHLSAAERRAVDAAIKAEGLTMPEAGARLARAGAIAEFWRAFKQYAKETWPIWAVAAVSWMWNLSKWHARALPLAEEGTILSMLKLFGLLVWSALNVAMTAGGVLEFKDWFEEFSEDRKQASEEKYLSDVFGDGPDELGADGARLAAASSDMTYDRAVSLIVKGGGSLGLERSMAVHRLGQLYPGLSRSLQQRTLGLIALRAMRDSDESVRMAAVQTLSDIGTKTPETEEALVRRLEDAYAGGLAYAALGRMRSTRPEFLDLVLRALIYTEPSATDSAVIARQAADWLAAMGPTVADRAVPALIEALRRNPRNYETDHAMIAALEKFGVRAKAAIPLLQHIEKDAEATALTRRSAAWARESIQAVSSGARLSVADDNVTMNWWMAVVAVFMMAEVLAVHFFVAPAPTTQWASVSVPVILATFYAAREWVLRQFISDETRALGHDLEPLSDFTMSEAIADVKRGADENRFNRAELIYLSGRVRYLAGFELTFTETNDLEDAANALDRAMRRGARLADGILRVRPDSFAFVWKTAGDDRARQLSKKIFQSLQENKWLESNGEPSYWVTPERLSAIDGEGLGIDPSFWTKNVIDAIRSVLLQAIGEAPAPGSPKALLDREPNEASLTGPANYIPPPPTKGNLTTIDMLIDLGRKLWTWNGERLQFVKKPAWKDGPLKLEISWKTVHDNVSLKKLERKVVERFLRSPRLGFGGSLSASRIELHPHETVYELLKEKYRAALKEMGADTGARALPSSDGTGASNDGARLAGIDRAEVLRQKKADIRDTKNELVKVMKLKRSQFKMRAIKAAVIAALPILATAPFGTTAHFHGMMSSIAAGLLGLVMVVSGPLSDKLDSLIRYLRGEVKDRGPLPLKVERGQGRSQIYRRPPSLAYPGVLAGGRAYKAEARHFSLSQMDIDALDVLPKKIIVGFDGEDEARETHTFNLFSYYDRTRTDFGKKRLEWLLTHPYLDAAEIKARQDVVGFWMRHREKRASIRALLNQTAGGPERVIEGGLESAPRFKLASIFFKATIGAFAVIATASLLVNPLFMMLLMLLMPTGTYLGHMASNRAAVASYMEAAYQIGRELQRIPDAEKPAALLEIQKAFSALWDWEHPDTLADIYINRGRFMAIDKLFKARRAEFEKLVGAVAELDAYAGIAQSAIDHELSTMPEVLDRRTPYLEIKAGIHPLSQLKPGTVPNDATFDPAQTRFYILEGPNEAGKSTYLKMIAANLIWAQIGGPVAAEGMRWTPVSMRTHMNIQDSLEEGISRYAMETDVMRDDLGEMAEDPMTIYLYVADEMFEGTNPVERLIVQKAGLKHAAGLGVLGIVATHDHGLIEYAAALPGFAVIHVHETLAADGSPVRDYKVHNGPARTTNALTVVMRKFKGPQFEAFRREIERLSGDRGARLAKRNTRDTEDLIIDVIMSQLYYLADFYAAALTKAERADLRKTFYGAFIHQSRRRIENATSVRVLRGVIAGIETLMNRHKDSSQAMRFLRTRMAQADAKLGSLSGARLAEQVPGVDIRVKDPAVFEGLWLAIESRVTHIDWSAVDATLRIGEKGYDIFDRRLPKLLTAGQVYPFSVGGAITAHNAQELLSDLKNVIEGRVSARVTSEDGEEGNGEELEAGARLAFYDGWLDRWTDLTAPWRMGESAERREQYRRAIQAHEPAVQARFQNFERGTLFANAATLIVGSIVTMRSLEWSIGQITRGVWSAAVLIASLISLSAFNKWAFENRTAIDRPTRTGPYAWLRHPEYALEFTLFSLPIFILLPYPIIGYAMMLHLANIYARIIREERSMWLRWGEVYAKYRMSHPWALLPLGQLFGKRPSASGTPAVPGTVDLVADAESLAKAEQIILDISSRLDGTDTPAKEAQTHLNELRQTADALTSALLTLGLTEKAAENHDLAVYLGRMFEVRRSLEQPKPSRSQLEYSLKAAPNARTYPQYGANYLADLEAKTREYLAAHPSKLYTFIARVYDVKQQTGKIAIGPVILDVEFESITSDLLISGLGPEAVRVDYRRQRNRDGDTPVNGEYEIRFKAADFKLLIDKASDAAAELAAAQDSAIEAVLQFNLDEFPGQDLEWLAAEINIALTKNYGKKAAFLITGPRAAELKQRVTALKPDAALYIKEAEMPKELVAAPRTVITAAQAPTRTDGNRYFFMESVTPGQFVNWRGAFITGLFEARIPMDQFKASNASAELLRGVYQRMLGKPINSLDELLNVLAGNELDAAVVGYYRVPPIVTLPINQILQAARMGARMALQAA